MLMLELMLTLEIGLYLLDIVSCERSSPTIRCSLCVCGWEISSWVCYVVEEKSLYKYVLDWLIQYIELFFAC